MKKSIGQQTIVYPHPVFIIGTYDVKNKPNIMTVSWGGICCSKPPCIAISLRKATYTFNSIKINQAFTVNIPTVKYAKEAELSIFEYIELFYNRQRLHSSLNYMSPDDYEKFYFENK